MTTPRTVVLAGGRGRRMAPFTSVLPKPLMPLGEHSVLEILLAQLRRHGFTDVTLCVGYLSHLIRAVVDSGRVPGVNIDFVQEPEPLGTAGPLRLIDGLTETFVVMNGDVLTSLDLRALVSHHHGSGNLLTIATHERVAKIDFGILTLDNGSERVVGYQEKPEFELMVSMGVYVVEPQAVQLIPVGYFDFPELVAQLISTGGQVGAYVHRGYWLDIGRHDDYERAAAAWAHTDGDVRALAEIDPRRERAGYELR